MDTLEMWVDFCRGEVVRDTKRTAVIACQHCERKPSNPAHDHKAYWEDDRSPVYVCDDCAAESQL